jgi:hypothetical protein
VIGPKVQKVRRSEETKLRINPKYTNVVLLDIKYTLPIQHLRGAREASSLSKQFPLFPVPGLFLSLFDRTLITDTDFSYFWMRIVVRVPIMNVVIVTRRGKRKKVERGRE